MKTWLMGLLISLVSAGLTGSETWAGGDETVDAPAFSVVIKATDARTGKALQAIRVVPTPYNARAKQVTWQSQYAKKFESRPAVYSLKRGWKETLLRIEADGYRPVVTDPLPQTTEIPVQLQLEPDEGIAGRVLSAGGQPVEGAMVAVCTWTNEVTVRDGTLTYGHHAQRLRELVQTAQDGSFRTPAEIDPWMLVVAHPSGYAEMSADQFARNSDVMLQPWGRLEGEFLLGGLPAVGHVLNIGAGHGGAPVVLHYSAGEVALDQDGRFVADRLPPVKMYVTPLFKVGQSSVNLLWFSGLVEVKPGETTRISVPRPGQTVTGRLVVPPDSGLSLDQLEVELSLVLRPPSLSAFGNQSSQLQEAYSVFLQSPQGESFRRDKIAVDPQGRFRIEGLPETDYVLRATAYRAPDSPNSPRGSAVAQYTSRVKVPPQADNADTLDLGQITLQPLPQR